MAIRPNAGVSASSPHSAGAIAAQHQHLEAAEASPCVKTMRCTMPAQGAHRKNLHGKAKMRREIAGSKILEYFG